MTPEKLRRVASILEQEANHLRETYAPEGQWPGQTRERAAYFEYTSLAKGLLAMAKSGDEHRNLLTSNREP